MSASCSRRHHDLSGEKAGRFLPPDPAARREVFEWLMWQMGDLGPMLGQAHHFLSSIAASRTTPSSGYLKEARRLYGVLDERLAGRAYIAGDYSIADMAVWPWISRYEWQTIDLGDFANASAGICSWPNVRRSSGAITCRRRSTRCRGRERPAAFVCWRPRCFWAGPAAGQSETAWQTRNAAGILAFEDGDPLAAAGHFRGGLPGGRSGRRGRSKLGALLNNLAAAYLTLGRPAEARDVLGRWSALLARNRDKAWGRRPRRVPGGGRGAARAAARRNHRRAHLYRHGGGGGRAALRRAAGLLADLGGR